MILGLTVLATGAWEVHTEQGGSESRAQALRAEEVLPLVERMVRQGGGWEAVEGVRADSTASASFTNTRLLAVWLNTLSGLRPFPIQWRQGDAWMPWQAPREIPYHAAPNISQAKG